MPLGSPAFLFLDEGRGEGLDRSGLAKASPAAAIPTVLEATSCTGQRIGPPNPHQPNGSYVKNCSCAKVGQSRIVKRKCPTPGAQGQALTLGTVFMLAKWL